MYIPVCPWLLNIVHGYSFEIDDVNSFSVIFSNFAEILANTASKQMLAILRYVFALTLQLSYCDNQI